MTRTAMQHTLMTPMAMMPMVMIPMGTTHTGMVTIHTRTVPIRDDRFSP